MLSINTNLSSIIAQHSMSKSTNALNQAIERMTTGFKINHAKDNAANYSISKNMSTKISSYNVAQDNCAMGLDMLTTAEENLNLITDKLQRLRDLQIQASNGTYGEQSLQAINAEANALVDEIERIYANAEYNGKKLFEKAETQAVAQAATYGARAATSGKFINEVTHRNTSSMTKFSTVPEDQILASGTYSISTVAELEKLARLTNLGALADSGGNAYGSYEFVLANDIDLSSVSNWVPIGAIPDLTSSSNCFSGVFDGNGYSVKNMTINGDANSLLLGLFGAVSNATIKNLGCENLNIKNTNPSFFASAAGGIVAGGQEGSTIIIDNCFTTGYINAGPIVAGVAGVASVVKNCYSTVTITGVSMEIVSGMIMWQGGGIVAGGDNTSIENCFYAGKIEKSFGEEGRVSGGPSCSLVTGVSNISNVYYIDTWTSDENKQFLEMTGAPSEYLGVEKTASELQAMFGVDLGGGGGGTGGGGTGTGGGAGASVAGDVSLQVGINSDSSSQISLEFSFSLAGVDGLRMIGLDTTTDYLKKLDNMLSIVSAKQTEYGAAQNRLESALESIEVNIENLTSSLSTIRDADISEVSSDYIRQQILQQASATLLATANQSPSIALQLI